MDIRKSGYKDFYNKVKLRMKLYLILVTLLVLFFSSSKAKQYLVETEGKYMYI